MRLHIKKIVLVLVLTGVTVIANALPGPTAGGPPAGTSPPPPPCWSPPCIPIDGGIGILLAAGAFVGARKLYKGTR